MADDMDFVPEMTRAGADGGWIRPTGDASGEPRWGHPGGLQVGLHPLLGPRGLLRIFTPYLDHPLDRLVNFIAIEPIPEGQTDRALSELEVSTFDGVRGKRFWSADDRSDLSPRDPLQPARGVVETVDGVERLRVFVLIEPFDNGADVAVRLSFRADRPHEVAIATWRNGSSVPLAYCVVTATMGNYARLRNLELAGRTVSPAELWPGFERTDFTEHARFPLADFTRGPDGSATVSATPDELDHSAARYAPDTNGHWKYEGLRARQTWRADEPTDDLEVLVNARYAYWASSSPIPGGASFENFELLEPFREGQEFTFAIEPLAG
ncbi:MAG: hypothetical protein JWR04_1574 [Rhodoglobus sp.]|nr:hypothetical protein [Rhodoglobus sp.]